MTTKKTVNRTEKWQHSETCYYSWGNAAQYSRLQNMSGRQAKPKVKVGRAVVTREIPSPLVPLSNSFSPANTPTPRREQSFFNPLFGTPTLSPGPGTEVSSVPSGVKPGPWLVSPPPPSQTEETKSFFSSPSAWFRQNLARKTLGSSLLAFSLGSVLFFVVLGVSSADQRICLTAKICTIDPPRGSMVRSQDG